MKGLAAKANNEGESIIMMAGDHTCTGSTPNFNSDHAHRRLKSIIILTFIGFIFVSLQASDRFDLLSISLSSTTTEVVEEGGVGVQYDDISIIIDHNYSAAAAPPPPVSKKHNHSLPQPNSDEVSTTTRLRPPPPSSSSSLPSQQPPASSAAPSSSSSLITTIASSSDDHPSPVPSKQQHPSISHHQNEGRSNHTTKGLKKKPNEKERGDEAAPLPPLAQQQSEEKKKSPKKKEGGEGGDGHQQQLQLGSCEWYPPYRNDTSDIVAKCMKTITDRILASSPPFYKMKKKEATTTTTVTTALPPLRWLFFGDSTIQHMWAYGGMSSIGNLLTEAGIELIQQKAATCPSVSSQTKILCQNRQNRRCNLNEAFQFPPISGRCNDNGKNNNNNFCWKPPNITRGEGPEAHGLNKPNCQDCLGCLSNYAICHRYHQKRNTTTTTSNASAAMNNNNKDEGVYCVLNSPPTTTTPTMYGGYFSMEFARDVEIQTPTYGTTQENVLSSFVQQHYNSDPWFLREFGGLPVCVVSAGIHDIMIQNITIPKYLINVDWYLKLLLQQCQHIIWLQNTAPKRIDDNDPNDSEWKQTQERVYQWNQAVVHHLINNTSAAPSIPLERITILDVFNASLTHPHDDNIHLNYQWYSDLGSFFTELAQKVASSSIGSSSSS